MDNADELVRWTVKVSKDTDVSLRSFLAQRGMKKGDLSKFIEQAVQKEVFAQTVADVEARNVNISEREIEATIDDALRQVRAEMWGNPRKARRTGKQVAKPAKRA
jgi:post-segregation antitoxin (ccd killing protein)